MGVLEFFGTLVKNGVTSSAIKINCTKPTEVNHLLLDFNSIIHVSGVVVTSKINGLMKDILKTIYENKPLNQPSLKKRIDEYKIASIPNDPNEVTKLFKSHFNQDYLHKLVITETINKMLEMIDMFTKEGTFKTLMIAIDGVPSKGKMIEQKQRRYMGVIMEGIKGKMLVKHTEYLKKQKDYIYLATVNEIKWSKTHIVPGTEFMHLMAKYLRSKQVQDALHDRHKGLNVIITDTYEIGEGEKKIVNYIKNKITNLNDNIIMYSPDADAIILCMILPHKKISVLKHDSIDNVYNIIDVSLLKQNIANYINALPEHDFDVNRINNDLACLSTVFGDDFVPKIETLNVKMGFQKLMDVYLKTLVEYKEKGYYLVKNGDGKMRINFTFFKSIIKGLLPEENDFIKHNDFYNKYIKAGILKDAFDYIEVSNENVVSIYRDFMTKYGDLQNIIRNNRSTASIESDDRFMNTLKKTVVIGENGQTTGSATMTNKDLIDLLKSVFRKTNNFPRVSINLNTFSTSINDRFHKDKVKDMNDYEKDYYKFEKMLDEYRPKLTVEKTDLSDINAYYQTYFHFDVYKKGKLTKEASQLMHEYIEGIMWVFEYYFNDMTYINTWVFAHERTPILKHILEYLDSIDIKVFNSIQDGLDKYHVDHTDFFNPIEQLIYVTPMTSENMTVLPDNYKAYIKTMDDFMRTIILDTNAIVDEVWNSKVSKSIDCRGAAYLNKCMLRQLKRHSKEDDDRFIATLRKIVPNEQSLKLSRSTVPPF